MYPSVGEFSEMLRTQPLGDVLTQQILTGTPFVFRNAPADEQLMRRHLADGLGPLESIRVEQRIRTVLQFIGVEADPDEQQFNKFSLDKVDPQSPYYGLTFSDLSPDQKRAFYGYTFSVRTLNTNNDDEVRDMFRRLNKFLTPLNAQELRNAIYTGPFIRLVESLADDPYWAENKVVTATQIRRMADLQFVSELLVAVMHGPQGGSAKIVDEYYEQYEDFDPEFPGQKRARARFVATLNAVKEMLPGLKETRWSNLADFYSLFAVIASLLREQELSRAQIRKLRTGLTTFAADVDRKLEDPDATVDRYVSTYSNNVQRGANDKVRRGERHRALLAYIKALLAS